VSATYLWCRVNAGKEQEARLRSKIQYKQRPAAGKDFGGLVEGGGRCLENLRTTVDEITASREPHRLYRHRL